MKRKFERVHVIGVSGDLATDKVILNGIVDDVSPGGFKLFQLPASFQNDKHVYTVVISNGDNHFKILAKPCWDSKAEGKNSIEVGFKIIDAPWEWAELTYQ